MRLQFKKEIYKILNLKINNIVLYNNYFEIFDFKSNFSLITNNIVYSSTVSCT